jgi:hypothetical protein
VYIDTLFHRRSMIFQIFTLVKGFFLLIKEIPGTQYKILVGSEPENQMAAPLIELE